MAKVVVDKMDLDKQVERYLAKPITTNDIVSYQINRRAGDMLRLTVEIYVDSERFDACNPYRADVTGVDKSEPEFIPKE